ncbi:hypothetical protein AVEN_12414-1 [Araneus ventricosus]|uniref:Uncharacterized protein n=1 Tax=Araneus ventricosus TaxID=182803 RepID=A0A4Y2UJG9_ARAVE|nr:hypothetical protein AVEN_12414-1 [Araneus ventricosus]
MLRYADYVNKILLDIYIQLLFNATSRQTLNIPNRPQRLNTTHYKSTTINLFVFSYASVLVNILKTHLFRSSLYSGCSIQELAGMARESIEHIPLHSGNHGRPVRDPNRPKISKALYVRFGRQFLGEDTPPEFLLGSHPELDSNQINIVRRVFRKAQRIARSKNRRSVIDSDVLLAMPPQT